MANPHRGSVAFQVGATVYTLSFSVNALCELEDMLNQPVAKIAESLNDPENVRLSTMRALAWAGLRDHHPEITIPQTGEIVSAAGVPATMEAVGKAFQLAFPEAEPKANPQTAAKAAA